MSLLPAVHFYRVTGVYIDLLNLILLGGAVYLLVKAKAMLGPELERKPLPSRRHYEPPSKGRYGWRR